MCHSPNTPSQNRHFLTSLGHFPGSTWAVLLLHNLWDLGTILLFPCLVPWWPWVLGPWPGEAQKEPSPGDLQTFPPGGGSQTEPRPVLSTPSWGNHSGNSKNRLEFVETFPFPPVPVVIPTFCKSGVIPTSLSVTWTGAGSETKTPALCSRVTKPFSLLHVLYYRESLEFPGKHKWLVGSLDCSVLWPMASAF